MNVWTIEHAPFPGEITPSRDSEDAIRRCAGIGACVKPSCPALLVVFLATFTLLTLTLSLWGTL